MFYSNMSKIEPEQALSVGQRNFSEEGSSLVIYTDDFLTNPGEYQRIPCICEVLPISR